MRNSLDGDAHVLTPAQSYNVDGYHAPSNTVYKYHGCFYHGCRKCTPTQRQKKRNCHPDRTIDKVYEATCLKTAILRDAGYTVIEKWGCEFAEQKKRLRTASLPGEVRDGASFRATRCLLRRTHWRHHSLCQNLRRGRHFLPRFHFPVPVGEQVRYLSSEIPRDYLQPRRPKHLPLLRDRPGRHPCSGTSFSSHLARKGRWETYVCSLQVLCPRRDGQTTPRVVQYVWSHS